MLWIGDVKRRLRLVTSGEVWIRSAHPNCFRSGQWARLMWQAEFRGRSCYRVQFEDGIVDHWAVDNPDAGYEFFPPNRFTGLLDYLREAK